MRIFEQYDFSYTEQLLHQYVESGGVTGASLQVIKQGETILEMEVGYADKERHYRMAPDTIFRIYSMTKPITAVMFMILYERGLIHLKDPVGNYLPGFRNTRVRVRQPDGTLAAEPARTPLTMHHLLTMTSGLPYQSSETPTSQEIGLLMQTIMTEAAGGQKPDLPTVANRLGQVPLAFHPGENWLYGLSLDIVGAVIEVVTGRKLSQVFQEEIFEPLGMLETGFSVPAGQINRLAGQYTEIDGQLVPKAADLIKGAPTQPPILEYGGGGLFSTRADYSRFAQMLLGGGELEGCRILSRKSIGLMRADHLTAAQKTGFNWENQRGYSYGLAVRTLVDPALAGSLANPGEFGWDGAAGTWFGVDPQEEMTIVYMVQRQPADHIRFIPRLQASIYSAL